VQLRVQERDRAVVTDARDLLRVDAPLPRTEALPLPHRQELLEGRTVDEDRLGSLGDRAGDTVLEAVPVARGRALRLECDGRVVAPDSEARAGDGELDTLLGMPDERRLGVGRPERRAEERGRPVGAGGCAELHHRDEDRRRDRREGREADMGRVAKIGETLGFRRALTGPQFRKIRHGVSVLATPLGARFLGRDIVRPGGGAASIR
jgi:hypothetical protein